MGKVKRMISIDEDLNSKLNGLANASKLIEELVGEYFDESPQDKRLDNIEMVVGEIFDEVRALSGKIDQATGG